MSCNAAVLFAHGAGKARWSTTAASSSCVGRSRRSRSACGPCSRAGAVPYEFEFEEAERVDHLEAGSEKGRGRGWEQGTGAQCGGALGPCVGEPRLDVVAVGHHVMIEQDEMRDVGSIGPSTEASSDGMLGRRRVHGNEGTRTSDRDDRTASDATALS